MNLESWINKRLEEIAHRLPTLVHTEPASFSCGYNVGYKQAMLDLDRFLECTQEKQQIINSPS